MLDIPAFLIKLLCCVNRIIIRKFIIVKIHGIKYEQSPNFTDKKLDKIGIIIHWTGGSFDSAKKWILNSVSKVSSHFLIGIDGERVQFVDTDLVAWHAGFSETKYGKRCNNYTIGIELEGPPSKVKQNGWMYNQLLNAADICKKLNEHYNFKFITDHSTISPERKIDVKGGCGVDLFPWDEFVLMTGINDYKE